jgi:integrase
MRAHLTDITVRALQPDEGKQLKVWDTKTPGFGVRVNGHTKSWIVMFGQDRQLRVLGRYPDMPLSDARTEARKFVANRKPGTTNTTFREALDQFFEVHVPTLKPRTQREIKRVLNRHFLPKLKGKRLDEVAHHDIARITDALVPTPSEAWHAFKDIRTFFKWCVPRYIPHSPCEGLKTPTRYVPRKRVLSHEEIKRVWKAAGEVGYPFGTILQLLILTGQRWSEIASLHWTYIAEKERTITLPETKNRDAHTFPYGHLVRRILQSVPRFETTDLLFPGRDYASPWNGAGKSKWQLDKNCRIEPWQILDLRRTFGTKLAELRVPPHIVERLLNHKLGTIANQTDGVVTAIAAVYNRAIYMKEMREAIGVWEKNLRSLRL